MGSSIGIMGGTFDPLHNGHLACAEAAREALGFDAVLFVPAGVPSFKQDSVEASAQDRLAMARLGVADHDGFVVDPLEVERSGIAYAVDTVEQLCERYPEETTLTFIVGSDAARALPSWARAARLAHLVRFAVVSRAKEQLSDDERRRLEEAGFTVELVDADTPAVSSAEVRERLRGGEPIAGLVPRGVERYIMDHGLYGSDERQDALSEEFYRACEAELATRVGKRRFEHSQGVAQTAAELARAYGADEREARLAGILHDWDKAYDDPAVLARADELGLDLDPELRTMPRLIHGLTAAAALRRDLPAIPESVLEAVRDHTIAGETMSDLAMIVYIADALEPHRHGARTDELREMVGRASLRELFLSTYEHLLATMLERRKRLYPRTVSIWNSYMEEEGSYRAERGADPFPNDDEKERVELPYDRQDS